MDKRDCRGAPDEITVEDDDGIEHVLPSVFEVCDVCDGKGTHVNPNIDRNGLTAEDFAEDPDFKRDYMGGVYDQLCNRCGGRRVVAVVDRRRCAPHLLELYDADQRAQYEVDAEAEAERRYFARFER